MTLYPTYKHTHEGIKERYWATRNGVYVYRLVYMSGYMICKSKYSPSKLYFAIKEDKLNRDTR